ncbi:hypothetical protein KSF81_01995 [Siccirubricoccus sp. G192]|nr:hypothetical protein [Siccirubricoccus sp. G192]MBV1795925.1 hypothetical protein [Siccirubricoccus sp. G192]
MHGILETQTLRAGLAAPGGGQRILLLDFDLFHHVGGGQSAYQRIIAQRPRDTFHYFRDIEPAGAPRPANAVAIPYRPAWRGEAALVAEAHRPFLDDYVACRNLAAAVARHMPGLDFDVVDVPDYRPVGHFVRPAFLEEGIGIGILALALHGTLSSAFQGNWPTGLDDGRLLAELRVREHLQFRAADARYAISDDYAAHWRRYAPLAVNRLDPLCLVGMAPPPPGQGAPGGGYAGPGLRRPAGEVERSRPLPRHRLVPRPRLLPAAAAGGAGWQEPDRPRLGRGARRHGAAARPRARDAGQPGAGQGGGAVCRPQPGPAALPPRHLQPDGAGGAAAGLPGDDLLPRRGGAMAAPAAALARLAEDRGGLQPQRGQRGRRRAPRL